MSYIIYEFAKIWVITLTFLSHTSLPGFAIENDKAFISTCFILVANAIAFCLTLHTQSLAISRLLKSVSYLCLLISSLVACDMFTTPSSHRDSLIAACVTGIVMCITCIVVLRIDSTPAEQDSCFLQELALWFQRVVKMDPTINSTLFKFARTTFTISTLLGLSFLPVVALMDIRDSTPVDSFHLLSSAVDEL
ncbi:hypothetical protein PFISCL1PPCAC_21910, partial [Pristionchus fissidentatus]